MGYFFKRSSGALLFTIVTACQLIYTVECNSTCFSCTDSVLVAECQKVTTCEQDEMCYLDSYITSDGDKLFSMGCRDSDFCESDVGKKGGATSGSNDVRAKNDVPLCSECCSSHLCNNKLCGHPHQVVDHCASDPCVHGTCIGDAFDYICKCEIGYIGKDCGYNDTLTNCTLDHLCSDFGCCLSDEGPGYTGDSCEIPESSSCDSGPFALGVCIDHGKMCPCGRLENLTIAENETWINFEPYTDCNGMELTSCVYVGEPNETQIWSGVCAGCRNGDDWADLSLDEDNATCAETRHRYEPFDFAISFRSAADVTHSSEVMILSVVVTLLQLYYHM